MFGILVPGFFTFVIWFVSVPPEPVKIQTCFVSITAVTGFAFEGFLPSVSSDMSDQTALPIETSVADIALEWFFTSVNLGMSLQASLICELLLAVLTCIR